ncbi:MAG: hypothetical protein M3Q97_05075 [Bacteroidota bacterium]|nr:hypothetical protein [Bacteroidota bacterium]
MQTLLAILLYLGHIHSPGTYYESYILNLEQQYRPAIEQVENDPDQMMIVDRDFRPQTEQIIVISDVSHFEGKTRDMMLLFEDKLYNFPMDGFRPLFHKALK